MNTTPRAGRALRMAAVVLTLAFLQCSNEPTIVATPAYKPFVINSVDSFDYTVTVPGVSTSEWYNWENTGHIADVNLSTYVSAGNPILSIWDADTNLVFTHVLDATGAAVTDSGSTGVWLVLVELMQNTQGTVHFILKKQ